MVFKLIKEITERVENAKGWDFSKMRDEREAVPWDYLTVVRAYLHLNSKVLDVGTGGGERFLELASCFGEGVGIDADKTMIEAACHNLPPHLKDKVVFKVMNQRHLAFPDNSFDLVINRQAPFTASEIVRVLKEEGYFITQQIAENNMSNIISEFGWDISSLPQSQNFGAIISKFERQDCRVVAQAEYNVKYFVKDLESLIFWLKAVLHKSATGFPESFDIDKHSQVIERIVSKYQTPRGIETNEHRRLLIIQKKQHQSS